jgi:hypothetical protein
VQLLFSTPLDNVPACFYYCSFIGTETLIRCLIIQLNSTRYIRAEKKKKKKSENHGENFNEIIKKQNIKTSFVVDVCMEEWYDLLPLLVRHGRMHCLHKGLLRRLV